MVLHSFQQIANIADIHLPVVVLDNLDEPGHMGSLLMGTKSNRCGDGSPGRNPVSLGVLDLNGIDKVFDSHLIEGDISLIILVLYVLHASSPR